jgi:replicative DNA helicase
MLNGSLEDNVLTAIVWNEELAGEIIERIAARDFSTEVYRKIAEAAIKFYKQHETPARAHIGDVLG